VTEGWYFTSHRLEFARFLQEKGWRVAVACSPGNAVKDLISQGYLVFPCHYFRESINPFLILKTINQIKKVIAKFHPDIVMPIALRPILLLGAVPEKILMKRINLLTGLGSLATNRNLPLIFWSASFLLRPLLKNSLIQPRSFTIVQNQDDMREACRLVGRRTRMIYKIPGTGINFPRKPALCKYSSRITKFLFVGRLLRDKGILDLLKAFIMVRNKYPEVRLEVVGKIDPVNPSSLLSSDLESWKGITGLTWLGYRSDVLERMRASECVVIPSYREGLPRVLLEAAVSARPVIVADIPGCRELVVPEKTGLTFCPGNTFELAVAMEHIHLRPDLGKRLASGLFRKAKKKCSVKEVGKTYEALFRKTLRA